ncbi:MAG: adenosine deaminase family protein [Actinomycetota bacterium]|nr:adenosine deaminase family protein [Actinomycetota bacterium]
MAYVSAPTTDSHPLDTLWQLVQAYGGDMAVPDHGALVDHLRYSSFAHFIETWWWMTGFLRRYEDFELVAESVAADLARQNIIYAEASFSPTDFARHGLDPQGIALAIRSGLDRVDGTRVALNCDLVRDTGPGHAARTLAAVLEIADAADIRGITIGGSEQSYPPELFKDVYRSASENGFRLTAHAGEAAGPESVRGALDTLGVERIGHGVRIIEDPQLLERVVADQIPLEVCPTSNIRTGVVSGWDDHPIGQLLESGANVTVSSDDPTFFHTSVAAELREVADRYRVNPLLLTNRAIAASWMTPTEKEEAFASVDSWWAAEA